MKKIVILSADRTGNGHKSSALSLALNLQDRGYEVKIIDSFSFLGKIGKNLEDSYEPVARKAPWLWAFALRTTEFFPKLVHWPMYLVGKRRFAKLVREYKPDLVVSNHPMFTKAISWVIKYNKLNVPFMVDVIDLVKPPKMWVDKNAEMVFVATDDVYKEYIKNGFREDQVVVAGFPIRDDIIRPTEPKKIGRDKKINFLIINPSNNLQKSIEVVKEINKLVNVDIQLICGTDKDLFDAATKLKEENKYDNMQIFGFVTDINVRLKDTHIVLTKAGPNIMLESVKAGCVVITTGHIPGQEENNYKYLTINEYGEKCEDPTKLLKCIKKMIKTGKINAYFKNVLSANCSDGTKIIADSIENYLNTK